MVCSMIDFQKPLLVNDHLKFINAENIFRTIQFDWNSAFIPLIRLPTLYIICNLNDAWVGRGSFSNSCSSLAFGFCSKNSVKFCTTVTATFDSSDAPSGAQSTKLWIKARARQIATVSTRTISTFRDAVWIFEGYNNTWTNEFNWSSALLYSAFIGPIRHACVIQILLKQMKNDVLAYQFDGIGWVKQSLSSFFNRSHKKANLTINLARLVSKVLSWKFELRFCAELFFSIRCGILISDAKR